jgi:hypothetical protein
MEEASIQLRVIDYQIRGFRRSAIVTNVLDPQRISRREFLGLSHSEQWATEHDVGLYHRRWEIETAFRELKVVQGMEGTLRGRTPETIRYEVAGHVLLYLLTRWLMVEAAVQQGKDVLRLSFTDALREIDRVNALLPCLSAPRQRRLIAATLREIAAHEIPLRPGRHYPRPNDGKTRYTGAGHCIRGSKLKR